MRLYLAGLEAFAGNRNNNYKLYLNNDTKVLTSFYYCNDIIIQDLIRQVGVDNILVDSGAFTFRMNGLKGEDIDSYTKRYIEFINKYNIKYFFEMDIDMCKDDLGKVKQLRGLIEKETGKKTIPVWHMSRGINEWKELVDQYDYIAIGGITVQLGEQFIRNTFSCHHPVEDKECFRCKACYRKFLVGYYFDFKYTDEQKRNMINYLKENVIPYNKYSGTYFTERRGEGEYAAKAVDRLFKEYGLDWKDYK